MTIARIIFDRLVPLDREARASVFEAEDGWTITEVEPGRVALFRKPQRLTVQDVPYTLHEASEPAVEGNRETHGPIPETASGSSADSGATKSRRKR